MTFFNFIPNLSNRDDLEKISIGQNKIVRDCIERIKKIACNKSTCQILFLGPRGIGKSHMLLRILHGLSDSDNVVPIKLTGDDYTISNLDVLCRRILDMLNIPCKNRDAVSYCRYRLRELKNNNKHVVLFVDNLQLLFENISPDLGNLRSIIQSDQSLSIVGSAVTSFDAITSHDEPFYKFFDTNNIKSLTEKQTFELIEKRLILTGKDHLLPSLNHHIKYIQLLVNGNPRLIHMLTNIIIRNNSLGSHEENTALLLDELTPVYRGRMEAMSPQQRRIFDVIAMSDKQLSTTDIAERLNILKPSIVVAQLHRMQEDGMVEKRKLPNKKNIRYNITERLFKMWHVMRQTRVAPKC